MCYKVQVPKGRRVVEYSGLAKSPGRGKGRGPRLWAYGIADLARLYGMPEGTVRQALLRKKFKPGDLGDVLRYWCDLLLQAEGQT